MISISQLDNSRHDLSVSQHPLVSVIIGNYNYEQFIGDAIESVINQTYGNLEIIVIDDGSNDKSRDIINQYGSRIIPIFKQNGGQPSVYNTGFAVSRGEIICFLDSDDLFVRDKIVKIVEVFNCSQEIGWCFHSVQLIDINNQPLNLRVTEKYFTKECDFRTLIKAGKIPPSIPPSSALCFRRSILEKILPMPTSEIIKSTDYYPKFMALGLSKGVILQDELTLQKIHNDNAATLRTDREYLKGRKFIYTGIWIQDKFPEFRKFANKMVALGIAYHWIDGENNRENLQAIHHYLVSCSWWEKFKINFIARYYYYKFRIFGKK